MTHHLNRGLFLENGPTLLAERDRKLRSAGQAYRLLAAVRRASLDTAEAPLLNRAA